MTRMQVYLPNDLYFDLKNHAQNNQVPMAQLIRESLEQHLYQPQRIGKRQKQWNSFVGAGKIDSKINEDKNLSSNIDKYLYGE